MTLQANYNLGVHLEISPAKIAPGDAFEYTIDNSGAEVVLVGSGYELSRWTPDGWLPEPVGVAFAAWAERVGPGSSGQRRAQLPEHIIPGRYRIGTTLILVGPAPLSPATPDSPRFEIFAELEVSP
jgi:hypothetical protein